MKLPAGLELVEPLEFSPTRRDPSFDIGVRKHSFSWGDSSDLYFQACISANGIEASRNMNLDELIAIRDWIDDVVKVCKKDGA